MYLSLSHTGKKLGVDKGDASHSHCGFSYLDRYAQHFNNLAYRPFNLLEIGVLEGKSLEMWKECLPTANIWGIDVTPKVAELPCNKWAKIRIGSQDDPAFLRSVAEEAGGFGLVVDDGSHVAAHMKIAFDTLWPYIDKDGWYAIEDLRMTYSTDWTQTQAGFGRDPNKLTKTLPQQSREPIQDLLKWATHNLDHGRDMVELHCYSMLMLMRKVRSA